MSLEVWLAFVVAASIVLVVPGPTILLVISQAVVHGNRSVLPMVAGVALGDLTAMTLSLLGLGTLLAASAAAFTALKWAGACYLVYLGVMLFRSPVEKESIRLPSEALPRRVLMRRAYVVTALNPKGIIFFIAFMPQFVTAPEYGGRQLALLGMTFLFLATINACAYGMFAGRLHTVLKNSRMRRLFNCCGGGALVGAGIVAAMTEAR